MLFNINHCRTGKVLFSRDMPEGSSIRDVLREAVLAKANLFGADLAGADLAGADLAGADLNGTDLSGANLRGSDLSGADLSGANLRGSDLSGADLSGAKLRGADLSGIDLTGSCLDGVDLTGIDLTGSCLDEVDLPDLNIPVVPNLHTQMLAAIRNGGTLDMSNWHGYGHACKTTHCRSGWSIHIAGEAGYALEKKVGSELAGALIHVRSCPYLEGEVPDFYASNANALADIERCAKLEAAGN